MDAERQAREREHDRECVMKCYLCERPKDAFKHVHVRLPDRVSQIVVCIPCIASLAARCIEEMNAYVRGGYRFDEYIERMRRQMYGDGDGDGGAGDVTVVVGQPVPAPPWLEKLLKELFENEQGGSGSN